MTANSTPRADAGAARGPRRTARWRAGPGGGGAVPRGGPGGGNAGGAGGGAGARTGPGGGGGGPGGGMAGPGRGPGPAAGGGPVIGFGPGGGAGCGIGAGPVAVCGRGPGCGIGPGGAGRRGRRLQRRRAQLAREHLGALRPGPARVDRLAGQHRDLAGDRAQHLLRARPLPGSFARQSGTKMRSGSGTPVRSGSAWMTLCRIAGSCPVEHQPPGRREHHRRRPAEHVRGGPDARALHLLGRHERGRADHLGARCRGSSTRAMPKSMTRAPPGP